MSTYLKYNRKYKEWRGDLKKPHGLWDLNLLVDWCLYFIKWVVGKHTHTHTCVYVCVCVGVWVCKYICFRRKNRFACAQSAFLESKFFLASETELI